MTSLNEELSNVEWGEYRLGDLFDVRTTKSIDKNKLTFRENGRYDFIGRSSIDNGVQGKIDRLTFAPNRSKTYSLAQVGESICCFRDREWYASQNIFILIPKIKEISTHPLGITTAINKALFRYSSAYIYPTLADVKEIHIQLPRQDNMIDFSFMGKLITKLESRHISELEAYLSITGLKDYDLTDDEQDALNKYKNVEWREFRMGTLFEKIGTKKLPFKAEDLPKQVTDKYKLPCLTSSFRNQGLNYFVPREETTILKNVVSLPSNSDVYRAYYQSNEFTVLSDAYAIRWILDNVKMQPCQYLFAVTCINKITNLPIYSYKNKLGGWNVVRDKYIQLPVKNGKPDYEIMGMIISAIQKCVIKDVVLYTERKNTALRSL